MFLEHCGGCESLGTTTCREAVLRASKGMLRVKHFCPAELVFSTVFLDHWGGGESLGTTTCHDAVLRASKGMLRVKYFCPAELVFPPCFLTIVVEVKALGPPHVMMLCLGQARECSV